MSSCLNLSVIFISWSLLQNFLRSEIKFLYEICYRGDRPVRCAENCEEKLFHPLNLDELNIHIYSKLKFYSFKKTQFKVIVKWSLFIKELNLDLSNMLECLKVRRQFSPYTMLVNKHLPYTAQFLQCFH